MNLIEPSMADVARFTELLFAETSLDKEAALDGTWILLTKAAEHVQQGEPQHATKVLLEIADSSNTETRILLWSWAALRRLGVPSQIPSSR
jgi:hypothetical protein